MPAQTSTGRPGEDSLFANMGGSMKYVSMGNAGFFATDENGGGFGGNIF